MPLQTLLSARDSLISFKRGRLKSAWERQVYKNEPKISSKDFPKVNDPTNIGVYGNVFCLDKVWIVAEQKGKTSLNFCTSGAGAKDSEGVQSGPTIYRQHTVNTNSTVNTPKMRYNST